MSASLIGKFGRLVHRLERFSDKEEADGSIPSPPTRVSIIILL